jgi:hypothetical protein
LMGLPKPDGMNSKSLLLEEIAAGSKPAVY